MEDKTRYQRRLNKMMRARLPNYWCAEYLDGPYGPVSKTKEWGTTLEPTFRAVIKVADQDEAGRPLDPQRPDGPYWGCGHFGPLMDGEINFEGPTLWRNDATAQIPAIDLEDDDDFCLIDETDVF
jgi:hypothetical protein